MTTTDTRLIEVADPLNTTTPHTITITNTNRGKTLTVHHNNKPIATITSEPVRGRRNKLTHAVAHPYGFRTVTPTRFNAYVHAAATCA